MLMPKCSIYKFKFPIAFIPNTDAGVFALIKRKLDSFPELQNFYGESLKTPTETSRKL
jgi:hypothetical protein